MVDEVVSLNTEYSDNSIAHDKRPTKPIPQVVEPAHMEFQLANADDVANFFEAAAKAIRAGATIKIIIG